jgi:hypothetical protein
MAKDIKRIPVAFNLLDPDQKAMYDHVQKRTNMSFYLKRLIQRDMEGGSGVIKQVFAEEMTSINDDFMEGLV